MRILYIENYAHRCLCNRGSFLELSRIMEASEGRDMSKFFANWEGKTCFIRNRERVTVFLARKKLLYVALLTLTC